MSGPDATPAPVRFGDALRFWLKLGFISFGGPAGQIAIMHAELVERRRWISERRFLHALNYCMVLPGPEAQQLATYLGWLMHRTWGGVVAGALFVLPSLVLLIALSWVYMALGHWPVVAGILYGIKPAVTAIVLHAAWRIGSRTLRNAWLGAVAAAAFLSMVLLNLPFPAIVLAAALCGVAGSRLAPQSFVPGGHAPAGGRTTGPALIDDATPLPAHAHFKHRHLARVLAVGAALWLLPMGMLVAWMGIHGPYAQMGWFFTKAALLTFGGAYAVLPYVVQGAVVQYGWLTPGQMIDGLALGETTPGPLIMVVAFVAFVGAWQSATLAAWLGTEHRFAAAALAAVLVTWFTFLPSFVFILAGGPLVESTRGDLNLSGPLTAITAAVVGVIANLALFFGRQVLWPAGPAGPFDPIAAALALCAAGALFGARRGVIEVIVACGLAGLAVQALR
ncbi:MAG TPA: chromate efflux transporter [Burkholderiaceae bacterium]|nr:chromate efflux transporter [Burkholderiaceae bacterium]